MRFALPMRFAPLLAAASFALVCLTPPAWAQGWTVKKVSGQAWVRAGEAQASPIVPAMTFPGDARVTTSSNGRVVLHSSQGEVLVAPNSALRLGDVQRNATIVLQYKGRAEYEVAKLGFPHFAVETPLLSAAVKGTHFVVAIERARSFVSVDQGLVAVSERKSGKTADIGAGQTAISSGGPASNFSVVGSGVLPAIRVEIPHALLTSPNLAAQATSPDSSAGNGLSANPTGEADVGNGNVGGFGAGIGGDSSRTSGGNGSRNATGGGTSGLGGSGNASSGGSSSGSGTAGGSGTGHGNGNGQRERERERERE